MAPSINTLGERDSKLVIFLNVTSVKHNDGKESRLGRMSPLICWQELMFKDCCNDDLGQWCFFKIDVEVMALWSWDESWHKVSLNVDVRERIATLPIPMTWFFRCVFHQAVISIYGWLWWFLVKRVVPQVIAWLANITPLWCMIYGLWYTYIYIFDYSWLMV